MFDPQSSARVYGLPPGADFAKDVATGLGQVLRLDHPHTLARVLITVNSTRMARDMKAAFTKQGPGFLPRIVLITDLPTLFPELDPGPSDPTLQRKLELARLVSAVIKTGAVKAPRSALFDLTDSLQSVFAEMQSEGVSVETLRGLNVEDFAQHWQTALSFLSLAADFHEDQPHRDADGRFRQFAENAHSAWARNPPEHPILVAGSTGSRGATRLLMDRIARLPQGALVLPGFDASPPLEFWDDLVDPATSEDHPQYRFATLLKSLDLSASEVRPWPGTSAPNPERNRLISLALRPAPVTDKWIIEGQGYSDLPTHLSDLTLVEAPTPRMEALTIACRIRAAILDGQSVALISPDRMLTRQVTAALDRWRITPDDSAGQPLHLSASGQFLRLTLPYGQGPRSALELLTLLKSPICNSSPLWRGPHLRHTRELELFLRDERVAFPDAEALRRWAAEDNDRRAWSDWVTKCMGLMSGPPEAELAEHLAAHILRIEALSDGQGNPGDGQVWKEEAGNLARDVLDRLTQAAPHGGAMRAKDYGALLENLLQAETVRKSQISDTRVKILGTLEARVGTADVMILGGLNDGSWPEPARPDPWLNRKMRQEAGFTLPDRQIGLAAHDFQQAAGAKDVVMTRAVQSGEAPTIASRWLSRLTNLLGGLEGGQGPTALAEMKQRGGAWLSLAQQVEAVKPAAKAARPAPVVPVNARPRRFSVTQIETLIRDPYALYGRLVLGLRPLNPLVMKPDAPLRGTALHRVYELFVKGGVPDDPDEARGHLLAVAQATFEEEAPWPAVRGNWLARVAGNADWFIGTEAVRQARGQPLAFEVRGAMTLRDPAVTLVGKADRIDRVGDGVRFYDYKSGEPPKPADQINFNKQMPLEIAIARSGGFETIPPETEVFSAFFIGLGSNPAEKEAELEGKSAQQITEEFLTLMRAWQSPDLGYVCRRYPYDDDRSEPFEHLARYGEWADGDKPEQSPVT